MSINNVSAVTDAIKYVQGTKIAEETTTIGQDVKGAVISPSTGIFVAGGTLGAMKDIYVQSNGIKNQGSIIKRIGGYFKNLKDGVKNFFTKDGVKVIENGAGQSVVQGTDILVSTSLKDQLSNTIKLFEEKGAASAAKGGFLSKLFGKKAAATAMETTSSALATVESGTTAIVTSGAATAGATGAIAAGAKSASMLTRAKNVFVGSGAAAWALMNAGIGVATEIIPAYKKGGLKSAIKQTGKTAITSLSSAVGWTGGAAVGGTIGSWLGSLIGKGKGAVLGQKIGNILGGFVGQAVSSKVAKKIVGKSEVELLQEKEQQQMAQEIASDPAQLQELNQLVAQQLQEDMASGNITADTEKMAQYLNSGMLGNMSYNPSVNTTNNAQIPTNTTQATNWINQAASQIAQGVNPDYSISDDKLNNLFVTKNINSSAQNAQNSGNVAFNGGVNQMTNQGQTINYYCA